jgi:hypothetical protein
VGNKGHKVAVIEHQEVPLPAIREGHPGKGKEVILRFGDQLRAVFVPIEPKRDPGYLAGDLRSKARPGFETLRFRERAVDDIGVQKVAVFLFASVSFVSVADNSDLWLATAVSIARSRAFSAEEGKSIKASIIVSISRISASMLAFSSGIRCPHRRISSESAISMTSPVDRARAGRRLRNRRRQRCSGSGHSPFSKR